MSTAYRRTDLEEATCPVCGTKASLNYLRFHAIMRHRLRERKPIYDLLVKRTLAGEYSLPSNYEGPLLEDASPADLLTNLRSGTPPRFGLRAVTVGREKIFSDLTRQIRGAGSEEGVCHLVNGPPGAGKSHILNYVRETAFLSEAATFKVDIAADGVSLSELTPLINTFLDHGLLPEGSTRTGGDGVFDRALLQKLERRAREELADHGREVYSDTDLLNQMRRHILSISPRMASRLIIRLERYLPEFRPPDHIFSVKLEAPDLVELGDSMSDLLRNLGYESCVFLVDELEEDRNRDSYETLAHLINNVPEGSLWVLAATPDLLWNPFNGVDALSPHLIETFQEVAISLPPFSETELNQFAERVMRVYSAVHPDLQPEASRIRMFCTEAARMKEGPREFLIRLLSYLDTLPKEDTSGEKA